MHKSEKQKPPSRVVLGGGQCLRMVCEQANGTYPERVGSGGRFLLCFLAIVMLYMAFNHSVWLKTTKNPPAWAGCVVGVCAAATSTNEKAHAVRCGSASSPFCWSRC